ncbi:uncharacterized protein LACBIDRAFT_292631 [Laccaria bicolor S238N-H82]|uniref:Predicted protein n=1 Tax=Laccaria bicolor (strain S238N-H82 / ATCC MYA-4686) TaxID=486041 RepID=B0CVY9_LACBS|nr:uncharacterized protein LACBIDRAFT_292631 [Laccaria bicolor S238N-H82]EDR13825.1 predicted protein [Laccaria bicolor S238N-H82]|eukprot:XP_001876323.1 predicted protein [Laccaria bicolor S238N-H82]
MPPCSEAPMLTDDLNFSGGDIVLAVRDSKYRVHKAVLGSRSAILAELSLSAPQQTYGGDKLPTVQIYEDHAHFALLLHALYDHDIEKYLVEHRRIIGELAFGVMGLAEKYNVSKAKEIQAKFLPLIKSDWPSTLTGWDSLERQISLKAAELDNIDALHTLDKIYPEPACVIQFTHSRGFSLGSPAPSIPDYLPAAFYHLARLPPHADPDDISLQIEDLAEGLRTARKKLLSNRDMICLLHGLHHIRAVAGRIACVDFPKRARGFSGATEEEKAVMLNWWHTVGAEKLVGPQQRDLVGGLKFLIDALGEGGADSDACSAVLRKGIALPYRKAMRDFLNKEREEFWSSLKEYFALYAFFS